jgi:hypothetical protein
MHIGNEIKKRREAMYGSIEEFVIVTNISSDKLLKVEEAASWKDLNNIKMWELHRICHRLNVDEAALYRNEIKDRPYTLEILEELEPGGQGTIEQRVIRLASHCVISTGRAAEILNTRDSFPVLESTGCTCLSCREWIKGGERY